MRILSAADVRAALDWPALVAALREGIGGAITAPSRHRYGVPVPGQSDAALLVMPAWQAGRWIGVKLVTFFPDAERRINAAYMLFDGDTGAAVALIDGEELTARRTAAASILAAQHLARPEASRLLIIGTGRLATEFAEGYAAMLPIDDIRIAGRDAGRARSLVDTLRRAGLPARISNDIQQDAAAAHIISCVTSATSPVLNGAWLSVGTHVDLVGGFQPNMREADDAVFRRAAIVFADFAEPARRESGDLIGPFASGALSEDRFGGELADLVRRGYPGRTDAAEITVFKSVGHASEDLIVASLLMKSMTELR